MKKQKRNENYIEEQRNIKKFILKRKIVHYKKLPNSKENAVTLIELIISIVVLLILAGISLSAIVRRKWNIK